MAKLSPQGFQETTFVDRGEAEAFLSQITESISAVRFEGAAHEFHMSYAGGSLGRCDLHRGAHSRLSFNVRRADEYHIIFPTKHVVRFIGGDGTQEAVAGRSAILLRPGSEGRGEAPLGGHGISLITSATSLSSHAEKLMGKGQRLNIPAKAAMTFDLTDPIVATLARNVSAVFHEMLHLANSGLSSLASANFDDLLLGLASATIWPGIRNRFGGGTGELPPNTVVRRARDFIQAHASEPLRLADLARDLGVGLRALQIGFQRYLGCSPREYLMACRLQLARARLLAADAGTKVVTVAFECGFTDLAVFSAKYRQTFGELPSETLRRRQ